MLHIQGKLGRTLTAAALAAVVSLAGPTPADAAAGRIAAADPWGQLAEWWQNGFGILIQRLTPAALATPALRAKDLCPPTGCPPPPPSAPPPPGGDGQGSNTDPDGRP